MEVIIYKQSKGPSVTISLAPGVTPADVQALVPKGADSQSFDASKLPAVGPGEWLDFNTKTRAAIVVSPTPTPTEQAVAAIASGLTITSTATPALDGTYLVASGVSYGRDDIAAEAQFVSAFSEFTNGTTTLEWPLIDGKTMVTFPTTADFMNFAKAAAQFYAGCQAFGRGAISALPSASVTIP